MTNLFILKFRIFIFVELGIHFCTCHFLGDLLLSTWVFVLSSGYLLLLSRYLLLHVSLFWVFTFVDLGNQIANSCITVENIYFENKTVENIYFENIYS